MPTNSETTEDDAANCTSALKSSAGISESPQFPVIPMLADTVAFVISCRGGLVGRLAANSMYERVVATVFALSIALGFSVMTAQQKDVQASVPRNDATGSPARNQSNASGRGNNQSPAYPPVTLTVTTPEKSPEAQKAEPQQREREIAAQEDIRDFTRALTILAIVQAFITGAALFAGFMAARAAKKSADVAVYALNMAHRPQLVVRHVIVEGVTDGLIGSELKNGYVWVTNAGVLPATLLKVYAEWLYAETLPIENPVLKVRDTSIEPVVMAPASSVRIRLPHREIAASEYTFINNEVQGIRNGFQDNVGTLFLLGYLKYQDVVGLRSKYFLFKYDTSLRCFATVEEYPSYSYED